MEDWSSYSEIRIRGIKKNLLLQPFILWKWWSGSQPVGKLSTISTILIERFSERQKRVPILLNFSMGVHSDCLTFLLKWKKKTFYPKNVFLLETGQLTPADQFGLNNCRAPFRPHSLVQHRSSSMEGIMQQLENEIELKQHELEIHLGTGRIVFRAG